MFSSNLTGNQLQCGKKIKSKNINDYIIYIERTSLQFESFKYYWNHLRAYYLKLISKFYIDFPKPDGLNSFGRKISNFRVELKKGILKPKDI